MSKQVTALCVAAVIAAGLLFWTCGKKNPAGPDDGGYVPAKETYGYVSNTTSIFMFIPRHVDTNRYCADSLLVTNLDTINAYTLPYSYVINGTTLMLKRTDSAFYTRTGTGTGLTGGTWVQNGAVEEFPADMAFTADSVTLTMADSGGSEGDDYIRNLWPVDSVSYHLTLSRISSRQVQLTGTVSGETVTLTWNTDGDKTVTSSSAGHYSYTYYANPRSCPNNPYPAWYYSDFLGPNARN